jgi:hypothetical protein
VRLVDADEFLHPDKNLYVSINNVEVILLKHWFGSHMLVRNDGNEDSFDYYIVDVTQMIRFCSI